MCGIIKCVLRLIQNNLNNNVFGGQKMRIVKKVMCLIMCAGILLSFAACSTVNTTPVFSYENTNLGSDYYSFVLSYEKGYYTALFKSYYGVDLEATPSYWDTEFAEGEKLADSVCNDINAYCKMILICNYLCEKYDIKLTEELANEIEENMQLLQDKNGGDDMFVVELAKLGCDKNTVKRFLTDSAKIELLRDYLYGESGIQKVPAADIEAEFFKNYKKVDSMSFSFYKVDKEGNYSRWLGDYTENEILAYFLEHYKNVDYLFYEKGKNESKEDYEARVKAVFDDLKNGKKTYDEVKDDADKKYKDWAISYGNVSDEFLDEITKLTEYTASSESSETPETSETSETSEASEEEAEPVDISKCVALLEDDDGLHIFIRKPISGSLLDDELKENCIKDMSANHISDYVNDYFNKVKSGEAEFGKELDTEFYSTFVADNIFVDSDMDESFIKKFNELKDGEYMLYTTKDGLFVCRKQPLKSEDIHLTYTDSYYGTKTTYYEEIETNLIDEAFYNYLATYYDSITVNNSELEKYDIRTAVTFGGDLWG